MDILFVFYKIDSHEAGEDEMDCYQYIGPPGGGEAPREVLLIDLLTAWRKENHPILNPAVRQYAFYAIDEKGLATPIGSPARFCFKKIY